MSEEMTRTFFCAVHGPLVINNWCEECGGYQGEEIKVPRKVLSAFAESRFALEASEARVRELTKPGDELQSAASRLREFVLGLADDDGSAAPHEVHMAALEAGSAIEQWTTARAALSSPSGVGEGGSDA